MRKLFGLGILISTLMTGILAVPATANASQSTSCPFHNVAKLDNWDLHIQRIPVPGGSEVVIRGHVRITLRCDIKEEDVSLYIQRHDRFRDKSGKLRFRWANHGDHSHTSLDGKKAGFKVTLGDVQADCDGIANWRLRLFASPGVAGDGKPITLQLVYYSGLNPDGTPNFTGGGHRFVCPGADR